MVVGDSPWGTLKTRYILRHSSPMPQSDGYRRPESGLKRSTPGRTDMSIGMLCLPSVPFRKQPATVQVNIYTDPKYAAQNTGYSFSSVKRVPHR